MPDPADPVVRLAASPRSADSIRDRIRFALKKIAAENDIGEITGISVIVFRRDGFAGRFAGAVSRPEVISAIAQLQHDILSDANFGTAAPDGH